MTKNKYNITDLVDEDRREFLARLVKTSAFSVPLALGLDVLTTRKAYAQDESAEGSTEGGTMPATDSTGSTGDTGESSGGGTTGTGSGESISSDEEWIPPPPSSSGGASIPEPQTLALLGMGLAAMELMRRRRKSAESSDEEPTES